MLEKKNINIYHHHHHVIAIFKTNDFAVFKGVEFL